MDKKEMSLRDTIPMMESDNYQDRFKAEFYQLKIRINKLANMLSAWAAGELGFQPSCPYELLESQLNSMKVYMHFLLVRAEIEGIFLPEEMPECLDEG